MSNPKYSNIDMSPKTDDLIAGLEEWCNAEHGRRAELARILDVQPNTVSYWLMRKHKPGSEETLKIVEFLADPEKFRKPGRGLK